MSYPIDDGPHSLSQDKRKGFSLKTLVADHELRKKGMKGVKALKKKLQRQGLGSCIPLELLVHVSTPRVPLYSTLHVAVRLVLIRR